MSEPDLIEREWVHDLSPDLVRLRCRYKRQLRNIVSFTVQLEVLHQARWQAVVRFDNAHGFCHRDDLHPNGTQEKTLVYAGTASETFTLAIEDIKAYWESHVNRFFREVKP